MIAKFLNADFFYAFMIHSHNKAPALNKPLVQHNQPINHSTYQLF